MASLQIRNILDKIYTKAPILELKGDILELLESLNRLFYRI